ncbi:MAG: M20/M25/M40 family metallo-hydrolase [Clostridia bacterium]|nr:M20/M25/M40 family metallo-hydrolase [Clostridia bacterium]
MKRLLKRLTGAFGPTGNEKRVADVIADRLGKENVFYDKMGNLVARISNEGKPKLVLSAHMDEVGFMVTEITDNGLIGFDAVGGFDPLVLLAKRVISERGVIGAIISKPIHLMSEDEKKTRTEIEDMYIDIGAKDRTDAENLVSLGDYFCFYSDFVEFGDGFIKAKAIDDRGGCAILCSVYDKLKDKASELDYDLYFAFTVREETGKSGVNYISERYRPDYAIVVEGTTANDLYSTPEHKKIARTGHGPAMSFMDGATIYDRSFIRDIMSRCDTLGIKYQIKGFTFAGTDAASYQRGADGARVAIFSLPVRYIHSQASVVKLEDIESTERAIIAAVSKKENR